MSIYNLFAVEKVVIFSMFAGRKGKENQIKKSLHIVLSIQKGRIFYLYCYSLWGSCCLFSKWFSAKVTWFLGTRILCPRSATVRTYYSPQILLVGFYWICYCCYCYFMLQNPSLIIIRWQVLNFFFFDIVGLYVN